MRPLLFSGVAILVFASAMAGCGGDDDTSSAPPGTGGSTEAGAGTGGSATGGNAGTGGNATGGSAGTGGNATGGSAGKGGAETGGAAGTGGTATGGASGEGGSAGAGGGSTGGNAGSGGASGQGGSSGVGGSSTGGAAGTGGSGGGCTPGQPPAQAAFFGAYADMACQTGCKGGFDAVHCKQAYIKYLSGLYAGSDYDAAEAALCLAAMTNPACDASACNLVFSPSGAAALGSPCVETNDCAKVPGHRVSCQTWSIASAAGTRSGKACQQVEAAAIGESCGETSDPPPTIVHQCDSDTANCSAGKCVALGGPGAACNWSSDCQDGFDCSWPAKTCAPLPAVGQACTGSCAEGAFCNASSKCEAAKVDGQSCGSSQECLSNNCDGLTRTCVGNLLCKAPPAGSITDFYTQYVHAYCEKQIAVCCEDAGWGFNQELCESFMSSMLRAKYPPNATLDSAQAAVCLGWLNAKTECDLEMTLMSSTLAADTPCDRVVLSPAYKAPGSDCIEEAECLEPAAGDKVCASNKCVQLVPADTGEACVAATYYAQPPSAGLCDSNDYCDNATDVCVAKSPAGGACNTDSDCLGASTCTSKVCVAKPANGSACTSDNQCASGRCSGNVCAAKLADGQPCTFTKDCTGTCVNGTCARDLGFGVIFCRML